VPVNGVGVAFVVELALPDTAVLDVLFETIIRDGAE
jgi:hypothetical protein